MRKLLFFGSSRVSEHISRASAHRQLGHDGRILIGKLSSEPQRSIEIYPGQWRQSVIKIKLISP